MPPPGRSSGTGPPGNSGDRARDGGNPGGRPGGPQSGQEPDSKPGRPGGRPGGGPDNNRPGPDGGGGGGGSQQPAPPPPMEYDIIYDSGVGAVMPNVKTGIIADQYAKLLDVPYRQAFMPGGPDQSIFAAKNVMPIETKADPRPYSKTNQIPIRDLLKLSMRDATDAELLGVETGPDKPLMSKDPYQMMSYQLDLASAPGSTFTGPGTKPPSGPITPGPGVGLPNPVPFPIGPIVPLPVVGPTPPITPRPGQPISIMPKPPSGGVFTPNPGGGGTYTGPGVNLPGPVIPLPVVGGPPKTGGNLIPLSNELGFTIDNEGNKIYSDSEGNPVFAADGGRIDKMDGGMMIIEDGVANDGIGGILKKYKEIRSEL